MPDLSAIIVSWNTRDLLARCLDALDDACTAIDLETIVIDNGSTDGTVDMLRARGGITVIANASNVGFAAANNQGLEIARSPFALLLNSDAFVNRAATEEVLKLFASQPRAGIVGVTVLNEDGTLQAAEGAFPTLRHDLATSIGLDQIFTPPRRVETASPVDWVHGACLFVRTAAYHEFGGLDTRFFMYSEEIEWCWRCRGTGWQVWIEPRATVVHLGGASSARDDLRRRSALYRSRVGLRRRMSGPAASLTLWCGMTVGLATRIAVRSVVSTLSRRTFGKQSAHSDWRLLCDVARSDPLARWAVS